METTLRNLKQCMMRVWASAHLTQLIFQLHLFIQILKEGEEIKHISNSLTYEGLRSEEISILTLVDQSKSCNFLQCMRLFTLKKRSFIKRSSYDEREGMERMETWSKV